MGVRVSVRARLSVCVFFFLLHKSQGVQLLNMRILIATTEKHTPAVMPRPQQNLMVHPLLQTRPFGGCRGGPTTYCIGVNTSCRDRGKTCQTSSLSSFKCRTATAV